MDNKQEFISIESCLDNVISSLEASEILNISQGYLRQLVLKGEFLDYEYKKIGKSIAFLKSSIIKRQGQYREYKKDN